MSNNTSRPVASSDLARQHAQRAAARADTTTPLPRMQTEQLPDLPAEQAQAAAREQSKVKPLVLSVTILHRGRMITISSEGRSLDQFCDLLDDRLGVAQ